jgi:nitrate reductase beta subunit
MTRKKIPVIGKYSLKKDAEDEGKLRVNGTGRTSKLFSLYKSYEVKKIGDYWKLYLIEKTTYEQLHGKPYR